jgi:SAM-dependent methyltransferase
MSQVTTAIDGVSLITPELVEAGNDAASLAASSAKLSVAQAQLALILNLAERRLRGEDAPERATAFLFHEMHKLRVRLEPALWQALVPLAQNHPVAALTREDPFTAWSFDKPRGYSGDARLLDFIYGHDSVAALVAEAGAFGRAVHAYTVAAPAAAAVRERRDLLAARVDALAEARGGAAEILTIASGHLREGALSRALAGGGIKRWVALDQDPLSVGTVARDFAGTPVEAVNGSVKGLLGERYPLGRFDFAYAAGLYDYLPHPAAVRLTQACLRMLKPGGTFLFANFNQDIVDDGYMETFMNWPLLLRSEREIWQIAEEAAALTPERIETDVFRGGNGNILYAAMRLAG